MALIVPLELGLDLPLETGAQIVLLYILSSSSALDLLVLLSMKSCYGIFVLDFVVSAAFENLVRHHRSHLVVSCVERDLP